MFCRADICSIRHRYHSRDRTSPIGKELKCSDCHVYRMIHVFASNTVAYIMMLYVPNPFSCP